MKTYNVTEYRQIEADSIFDAVKEIYYIQRDDNYDQIFTVQEYPDGPEIKVRIKEKLELSIEGED